MAMARLMRLAEPGSSALPLARSTGGVLGGRLGFSFTPPGDSALEGTGFGTLGPIRSLIAGT